jgi:DNA-binding CsgD family transcriptional regulator
MATRSGGQSLERGRAAVLRRAWGEAYAQLATADREAPLAPSDLDTLAMAARLVGEDEAAVEAWTRAHQASLAQGDLAAAAMESFWLAFTLLFQGDMARGGGWLARGHRILDEAGLDCPARGYLLLPVAVGKAQAGDAQGAYDLFVRAAEVATRFHDPTLMTFALHGQGRALVTQGEIGRGVPLLDEAMVAVTAGEVSPLVAGAIYCSLIETCQRIFDLRRADEWTAALTQWCASQPDLLAFRGFCMVHRAQIFQLRGAWDDALDEARLACERLSRPTIQPAIGEAWYQRAEVHRLRGEFAEAEEAYRQASPWRKPHPGLALLRLAQGRIEPARAAIRGVMEENADRPDRWAVLTAEVEIALASGDVPAARVAAHELAGFARRFEAPFLRALAAQAAGAVSLAEDDARSALGALRSAWTSWREIDAPYEAARVGVRIAEACRALGDQDGSRLELETARRTFEQLGAAPDLDRIERMVSGPAPTAVGPLTAREVEVLKLVASGRTNKAIADQLFISEKTVARHLSNIFNKLDLPSRAAATAYAYRNGLV